MFDVINNLFYCYTPALQSHNSCHYVRRRILEPPLLWLQNTLMYAHTTSRTLPTCDISLGSLMLHAPEAGELWNYSCYNCAIEKRFSLAGCYTPNGLERNTTAGRKGKASNTVISIILQSSFCHVSGKWVFRSNEFFILETWAPYFIGTQFSLTLALRMSCLGSTSGI